MKVSVIIPVGDRELYKTCRQSILRSFERSEAWARTEGLRRATGDYLAWVDCDDRVTERWAAAIQEGLRSQQGAAVDVLMYDVHVEWEDGRPGYDLGYGRPAGAVPADVFASDIIGVNGIGAWLWNKVFRRTLFEGKVFRGSPFEDYLMMCEVLPLVKQVIYLPEVLYTYQRRMASLSQYVDRKACMDGLFIMMNAAENVKIAGAVICCEVLRSRWRISVVMPGESLRFDVFCFVN